MSVTEARGNSWSDLWSESRIPFGFVFGKAELSILILENCLRLQVLSCRAVVLEMCRAVVNHVPGSGPRDARVRLAVADSSVAEDLVFINGVSVSFSGLGVISSITFASAVR